MIPLLTSSEARMDAALRRYVNAQGQVDYAALASDQSVRVMAAHLATCKPATLQTREQQLAFWINAYNMLTIVGILDEVQRTPNFRGVMADGLLSAFRFFYMRRYVVCGRKVSLSTIENRILRGELHEPRIHFVLVCGSASCPLLKNGLYIAETIHAELDDAARQFIRSSRGVLVERETHTVWLSTTFKWYRKDFARAAGSVLAYVARYLNEDDCAYLDRHAPQVRLRYFKYDWSLNGRTLRP